MPHQICCFSGTGNSLYVAKRIQEHLGDTELTQITSRRLQENISINAEVLGFVFPVYAWGPPGIVESFFKTMRVQKTEYTFVVAVHGGGPGNALMRAQKLLTAQGVSLDGAFDVKTPGNYVVGSDPASEEEARTIWTEAEPHLKEILESIVARRKTDIPSSDFAGMLKTLIIHPLFLFGRTKQGKKFYATEACTGCGICQKACPVENITLDTDKKPNWQNHCELCLACINLCPEQAIQSGENTLNRRRYRHPDIKVSELTNRI